MISKSKDHNPNYLAKILLLPKPRKHENADRLQCVTIDFQNVITGLDSTEGDLYVYFPVESCIDSRFLALTDSYRDSALNSNIEAKGFFEPKGRVKAIKLRGERSQGYIVPVEKINFIYGCNITESLDGVYFDLIGNTKLCWKYEPPIKVSNNQQSKKESKKLSRLVDGQVRLHCDTANIRKCINELSPDDRITISYKLHGTSGTAQHVLVKKKLNLIQKFCSLFVPVVDKEYDLVYTSRKVIKNQYLGDPKNKEGYYDSDIWGEMVSKYKLKSIIPKGYSIYYEIVGFTSEGSYIQKGYDYGCKPKEAKIYVYRVTFTNEDGIVHELNTNDCLKFCKKLDLDFVKVLEHGFVPDFSNREVIIADLEAKYNNKNCSICSNKVPEEGVVIRVDSADEFKAYKLKSSDFLEYESKNLN